MAEAAPPAGTGSTISNIINNTNSTNNNNNNNKKTNDNGGSVRPWELVLVSFLVMAMIGGAATAIVLGTRDDPLPPGAGIDVETGKAVSLFQFPTPPPPTLFGDDREEYDFLLAALRNRGAPFAPILDRLATTAPSLAAAADGTDPYVRAAIWLTSTDTTNAREFVVTRFALASIYYGLNGDQWTDRTNWLSPDKGHCEWHGIDCCPKMMGSTACTNVDFYKLVQIDLYRNNLAGPLPISIGLLSDLQSIFLNENQIAGTLPTHLGELPRLHRLYLQHNRFTGRIPSKAELDKSGLIDTLMLQGNGFTGNFTADWCDGACTVCNTPGLTELGLDCDKISCDGTCCKTWENCFYHSQLSADS